MMDGNSGGKGSGGRRGPSTALLHALAAAAAAGQIGVIEIGGDDERDSGLQRISDAVQASDQFSPGEKLAVRLALPSSRASDDPHTRVRSMLCSVAHRSNEQDANRLKSAFPDIADVIDIVRNEAATDVLAKKCAAVEAQLEAARLGAEAQQASESLRSGRHKPGQ